MVPAVGPAARRTRDARKALRPTIEYMSRDCKLRVAVQVGWEKQFDSRALTFEVDEVRLSQAS